MEYIHTKAQNISLASYEAIATDESVNHVLALSLTLKGRGRGGLKRKPTRVLLALRLGVIAFC